MYESSPTMPTGVSLDRGISSGVLDEDWPAPSVDPTAPKFGLIRIERPAPDEPDQSRTGCLGFNRTDDLDDLTAPQLRRLSADALAAAEWLEARA